MGEVANPTMGVVKPDHHHHHHHHHRIPIVDRSSVVSATTDTAVNVEVDFYRNPTILSRLILNQKYVSAVKRLRLHPEEASVWVCSKRQPRNNNNQNQGTSRTSHLRPSALRSMMLGGRRASQRRNNSTPTLSNNNNQDTTVEYSLRQLPIHVACAGLFRTSDLQLRAELEKLITHLVVAFPDGCGMIDHEGKLPLHEAIWHNGSPETISMLLMACPTTLHERDKFGRSPIELNRFRSGNNKAEMKELLLLGVEFWKQARQEAKLRLKHAFVPPCSTSVTSVSVLGMNPQSDMGSIVTGDSVNRIKGPIPLDPSFRKPIKIESEEIEPIAWSQLEKRAMHLEQLLAEMYEKNYELGEVIEELTRSKMELHDELEVLQGGDLASEVIALRRDNTNLTKDLNQTQNLLKEQGFEAKLAAAGGSVAISSAAASAELQRSRSKSPGRRSASRGRSATMNAVRQEEVIEYLEDKNASNQQRLDEMTQLNREQQLKIERLEMVIGSLWKQAQGGTGSDTDSNVIMTSSSWLQKSVAADGAYAGTSTDADASVIMSESMGGESSSVHMMARGGNMLGGEDSSMASVKSSSALSLPRDSDMSVASREDYTNLLEKIQSNSRFATERYLAGKVRDLEDKLNAAIDTAEAEVTSSREERNRLLKENEVLVAQVRALSSNRNNALRNPTTASGHTAMASGSIGGGGSETVKSDNLDELFLRAAAMYESDTSSSSSFPQSVEDEQEQGDAAKKKKKSKSSFLKEIKKSQKEKDKKKRGSSISETYLPGGLANTNSKETEPLDDDDLDSLVKEAQEVYGKPLPTYLIAALEGASSRHSASSSGGEDQSSHDGGDSSVGGGSSSGGSNLGSVEGLLMEAERLIGAPIPRDLVDAFQRVSTAKAGNLHSVEEMSHEEASSIEGFGKMDKNNKNITTSDNDEEEDSDVEHIIHNAEAMLGEAISEEMAMALRNVWPDSDNSASGKTSESPAGLFEDSTGSRTSSFGASSGSKGRGRRRRAAAANQQTNSPSAAAAGVDGGEGGEEQEGDDSLSPSSTTDGSSKQTTSPRLEI